MKLVKLILALICLPAVGLAQKVHRTVPTLADLLQLDPMTISSSYFEEETALVSTVTTQGRLTPGDGGGQTLFWNSAATTPTNRGVVFAAPYGRAVGRWIDTSRSVVDLAKWPITSLTYGSADNGPLIQEAIDYAYTNWIRTVQIPPGWFWVGSTIQIPSLIVLRGAGAANALDGLLDNAVSNAIAGDTTELQRRFAMFGGSALAKRLDADGPTVQLDTTRALTNGLFPLNVLPDGTTVTRWQMAGAVENLAFYGACNMRTNGWNNHAISIPDAWDFRIENCAFVRTKGYAVNTPNINGAAIRNNSAIGSSFFGSKGINFYGGSDTLIHDNYFFGCRGPGLWIGRSEGWLCNIGDNFFGNSDRYGYKTNTAISSSVFTTSTPHELETGAMVVFYAEALGDSLPAPLAADVTYYVVRVSDTQYMVSTNHLTTSTLTISGSYSTPFLVCPGPAVGYYLNDGAKGNVIKGGRVDQNYDQGIRIAGASRNAVIGTIVKQNGYNTTTGIRRTGTNVAGTTITSAGVWGAADNRAIGVVTIEADVAREFIGSASGSWPVGQVDDSASVSAHAYFSPSSLASINHQTFGETNGTIAVELIGGTGAASILLLNRSGSQSVGFTVSNTGVSAGTASGAVLVVRDQTNSLTMLTATSSSTTPQLYLGSSSGVASPRAPIIHLGEDSTGTDIAGGVGTVDSGKGTGTGTASFLSVRTPTPGTTGTTAQTMVERLRVGRNNLSQSASLRLYDEDAGTLRVVGVTNLALSDGVARAYLYLK